MTLNEARKKFPDGTPVWFEPVRGCSWDKMFRTHTSGEPWQLGDGTIVVNVHGKIGGVAVDFLSVREPTQF